MSSRKEEERNEKIIRGLMKLPPNRRCINCDSIGPQYVCTNFWTFICITCSGIHREFTHRVKSVSMAKFTTHEVEALQKGGNQRAREIYLKNWDLQRQRLPNSSNPDRIREFIKSVYLDRKYAGGNASEIPPRDVQNHRNHEEEHRRASSYHSYSQSPPYEHQYEERRYGRLAGMLTRKPGSDRGHDGKISSFIYSPGRSLEQMYEDRFANEGSGFQSPSSLKDTGFSSPPVHTGREIISDGIEHQHIRSNSESNTKRDVGGIPRPQRTASVGSFGSSDSNSMSFKSVHSFGFGDVVLEPEQPVGTVKSSGPVGDHHQSSPNSTAKGPTETSMNPPLDLFADINNQPQSAVKAPDASLQPPIDLFADFNDKAQSNVHPFTISSASPVDLFASTAHESSSGMQQLTMSSASLVDLFASTSQLSSSYQNQQTSVAAPLDLFSVTTQPSSSGDQHPSTSSAQSIDLFADVNHQLSSSTHLKQKLPSVSFIENEGWATFDLPQLTKLPLETNQASTLMSGGLSKESLEFFPSTGESGGQWSSISSSASPGSLSYGVANVVQPSAASNSSQSWNAFNDSTGTFPQTLFENHAPKAEVQVAKEKYSANAEHCEDPKSSKDLIKEGLGPSVMEDKNTFLPNVQFDTVASGSFFTATGGNHSHSHQRKSTNPFDLPYDSELESSGGFLDMTSLQATLPDPSIPTAFLGGVTHPWFPQNPVASYIPAVPQGSLAYMPGQAPSPQLPNISSQGPVASLGGNPFA